MYNPLRTHAPVKRTAQPMTMDQIKAAAPSVFATAPWEQTSEKYRFFPTSEVLAGLMTNGFQPVAANQSSTRIEGKGDFTRHIIRLRHTDLMAKANEAIEERSQHLHHVISGTERNFLPEVPELVLLNSHDGSSSYRLMLGFFRLVCANGLIVSSSMVQECRVRHSGRENLIDEVLEGSFQIINEAPKAIAQIEQWRGIDLTRPEQEAFAKAAIQARETTMEVRPDEVLNVRRFADKGTDLWSTMNVVQENLTKGGYRGINAKGESRHVRGVKSVDGDTKLNKALWTLAEEMAKIRAAA